MKFFLLVIINLLLVPEITGQEWIVPDDKKERLSTFPFDNDTRKSGEMLYRINCISCHGDPGKSNYLNLIPPPGDPATEKIQRNKDGEMFYKLTVGRGQMPAFRSVLTSTEIWNIISYIRSFNNTYKQQVMPVITSAAYPGAIISIVLSYNVSDSTVILNATASDDNGVVPVEGAELSLFVARTFGLMPVDEIKTTDKEGVAIFRIPDDLPGDEEGNIFLSARFTNEDIFGTVSKDTMMSAGLKTLAVSLVAERAMWNSVRKAPLWILLAYGTGLIAAWGFIFYVLMKLRDIFIIGRTFANTISEE
jgi:hypothetical protein